MSEWAAKASVRTEPNSQTALRAGHCCRRAAAAAAAWARAAASASGGHQKQPWGHGRGHASSMEMGTTITKWTFRSLSFVPSA
jgi:hypothetical protein